MADPKLRSRPAIIILTDSAKERLRAIRRNQDNDVLTLRLGVKNGGCAGMEYTMEWAKEQSPSDEVVESDGIKLLVEAKAVLFLFGTVMDYETSVLKSGFTFRNPNQTGACGCGESVQLKPAEARA